MVGYALGNRNSQENEIQILDEDNPNVVTYSQALVVNLFSFLQKDQLTIPYSTIKSCKLAREEGAREVIYYATDRPDNYPRIRSIFELWGFSTYVEYLYTVCELGFLEGLIPVIDLGFLKPDELRNLSEISALIRVMLDNPFDYKSAKPADLEKKLIYRRKNIEWCGKLNFPTITGYCVGNTDESKKYASWLSFINQVHAEYGTIHEVILKPIVGKESSLKEASSSRIKEAYKQAREALPEDIAVTIQSTPNLSLKETIDLGIRDLGSIVKRSNNFIGVDSLDLDQSAYELNEAGLLLHQRFPLRKTYIKAERYSKKLGQVFDSYRYKIKKEVQEKLKESKI